MSELYDEPEEETIEDVAPSVLDQHAQEQYGLDSWAEVEQQWEAENAAAAAAEQQGEAEQRGFQAATEQVMAMAADEMEGQLNRGEIQNVPADLLDLAASLAQNRDWARERGVELGSHQAVKLAI